MDWLDQILGKWGAALAKAAMSAAIVLILIFLLTCCIVSHPEETVPANSEQTDGREKWACRELGW